MKKWGKRAIAFGLCLFLVLTFVPNDYLTVSAEPEAEQEQELTEEEAQEVLDQLQVVDSEQPETVDSDTNTDSDANVNSDAVKDDSTVDADKESAADDELAIESEEEQTEDVNGNTGYLSMPWDNDTPVVTNDTDLVNEVEATYGTIPSAYPSSTAASYAISNYPATRNQGQYNSCWAFTSISLAELSLLKKGVYNKNVDLSELQLAYFTNNSAVDPLKGTAGDTNQFYYPGYNYLSLGGNIYYTVHALANWMGAASESTVPYTNAASTVTNGLSSSYAYNDAAHLENAYMINIHQNVTDVKAAIMQYGAVGATYYDDANGSDTNYSSTYNSYYCASAAAANHAVTIVGWDDNFSKSKFNTAPSSNGAWLIRNSWTTSTGENRGSYFWMSYMDKSLDDTVYAFDMASKDNYDNNYQYDGSMQSSYLNGGKYANVFTAHSSTGNSEVLKAVSVNLADSQIGYKVAVYTGLTNKSNPESGTLRTTVSGTTTYAGLHTIKLNQAISLAKGETYSIVITTDGTGIELEDGTGQCPWMKSTYTIYENQSFGYTSAGWMDFYDVDIANPDAGLGNLRIKAYTDDSNTYAVSGLKQSGASTSSIKLAWNKLSGVTGYQVYAATSKDGKYSKVATLKGVSSTSTTISSLKAGKSYYYKVRGYKTASGKTTYTSYTSILTAVTKPGQVSGLKSSSQSSSSNKLTWTKVGGASGYRVYYRNSTKDSWAVAGNVSGGNTVSFNHTGLKAGKTYYYCVKAYRGSGSYNAWGANSDSLTSSTKPAKVSGLAESKSSTSSIVLKWTKVGGASGYQIYRSTSKDGKFSVVGTVTSGKTVTYTDKSLKTAKTYYYKVRAYRTVSKKNYYGSASAMLTASTSPGQVSGVKASSSASSIKVAWTKLGGASGYRIYYRTSTKDGWTKLAEVKGGKTVSYTHADLKAGKTYYYCVKAYRNAGDYKLWGKNSSSITTSTKPAKVEGFVQTGATKNKITLGWNKVSGASGYQIYRATSQNGEYTEIAKVEKGSTVSFTDTKLKSKKTYYYKIRAYRTVSKKNYNGSSVMLPATTK